MSGPVGVERLPLFTGAPAPIAPWDPRRYQAPYVTAPLARLNDPPASHAAAVAAFPTAREQNKHIVACLLGMGPRGGTAEEIAEALNGGDPEGPWNNVIICRRIAGLRLNHVVSFDGAEGRQLVERPGRSGRPMTVHVARAYAAEPMLRLVAPEPHATRKAG